MCSLRDTGAVTSYLIHSNAQKIIQTHTQKEGGAGNAHHFKVALGGGNVQRSALVVVGGVDVDAGLDVASNELRVALRRRRAQLRRAVDLVKAQPAVAEQEDASAII